MSIFDLVLTGFDEIGSKMLNKSDLIDEIANFDHLRSFLACFTAPVSMSKSLNEYICPSSDWI